MNLVLCYLGGAMAAAWGIAHIVPTRKIVAGFGAISDDNRNIITMEWIGGRRVPDVPRRSCDPDDGRRSRLGRCPCLIDSNSNRPRRARGCVTFHRVQGEVPAVPTVSPDFHPVSRAAPRRDVRIGRPANAYMSIHRAQEPAFCVRCHVRSEASINAYRVHLADAGR